MISIERLLSNAANIPLITWRGQTLTQLSFARKVKMLAEEVGTKGELKENDFIILNEEDPISFYSLLIALWLNQKRVILPTRDYFSNPKSLNYYKHAVSLADNRIRIKANSNFEPAKVPDTGDVVAFSSGSTGKPKGILHDHGNFLLNATSVCSFFKESNIQSLTFLKPYLVSAISHFFVHFITESHLVFEAYENAHDCGKLFQENGTMGIVGSPIHLTSGLNTIPGKEKPKVFFSSGDFLSPATIERILKRFPGSIIYNVYGLAELAGRFFINRIDSDTSMKTYGYIGKAIPGTQYRIDDNQMVVSADFLFMGYIKESIFEPSFAWHPTNDLVQKDDGGMRLIGRADDEVKVLGNKVSLKHIENKIKCALGMDTAVVIASPHNVFGNILSLVLDSTSNMDRTELIRKIRDQLPAHEIPHQFFVIDTIPFTQSMKIDRKKIAEQLNMLKAIK